MTRSVLATVAMALLLGGCSDEPVGVSDDSGPRIELPRDDAAHPDEPVEWWYWTGHLEADEARRFGFELVFFRATAPAEGIMAHVAVTDVDAEVFSYDSTLEVDSVPLLENGFDLSLGPLSASGGDGEDELHGEVGAYVFDLTLAATKPAVLHHGDGYTDYPEGGYTYYYSRERMTADGTLEIDGDSFDVSGSAWFDHQYGDLAAVSAQGWDWYAIQLDDDREIMLFLLHSGETTDLIGGTYTDAEGTSRELAPGAVSIEAEREWTNGDGDCTYPLEWSIEVEDLTLKLVPVLDDQEVRPVYGPTYWEGATTVQGDATGRAYVELNGNCE